MDEQTEEGARRAYDTWRRRFDSATTWNELYPGAQVLWLNIAQAVESVQKDQLDLPDWADLREMARNAGWTPDTWMARDVHWGKRDPKRSLRTDLGWVSSRHFQGHHRVELHGPEPRPIRTAALIDPTPAEVLTAARLVGLGGAS